jgi:Flp pilus assembly pilin Flp
LKVKELALKTLRDERGIQTAESVAIMALIAAGAIAAFTFIRKITGTSSSTIGNRVENAVDNAGNLGSGANDSGDGTFDRWGELGNTP